MRISFILVILYTFFLPKIIIGQCGVNTPTFIVDLSNDPNGTYISPNTNRVDTCCGGVIAGNCVKFVITLSPKAEGVIFNIFSGAIPPGALAYQVGCGPTATVGEQLCLSGVGPHVITFCKPGGNSNRYSILSISDPQTSGDIVVNDGCIGNFTTVGFDPTSIQWRSITNGSGTYNNYLDCLNCDSVNVVAQPGFPPFVDFEVCGRPFGGCDTVFVCDTLRAFFNSTLQAIILPDSPAVCFGNSNALLTVSPQGGTPPYNYTWSTNETTQSISVGVGTYTVLLGDSSGCPPTMDTITVTEFTLPILADAGADQFICRNNSLVQLNGTVQTATGGEWLGGNGVFTPSRTDLNSTYQPTITEMQSGFIDLILRTTGNRSCPSNSDTIRLFFEDFDAIPILTTSNVSCFGLNDGSASLALSGGKPPFTYQWSTSTNDTLSLVNSVAPGTYSVLITDSLGCDSSLTFTISEPTLLSASVTDSVNILCFGDSSGSRTVTPIGGVPGYSYLWSSGSIDSTSNNLSSGVFNVTITDQNSCDTVLSVNLFEPQKLLGNIDTVNQVSCFLQNDGSLIANPTGGTFPYTFNWTSGSLDSLADNLAAGTYTVTITDNNGCDTTLDAVISQPNPLLVEFIDSSDVSCRGGNDGSAVLQVSGGTNPYTYLWSNTSTDSLINGVVSGNYSVTVSDLNNCDTVLSIFIDEPTKLSVAFVDSQNVSCFGQSDGFAVIGVLGGTVPYSFNWSNLDTDSIAENLNAGQYSVTVADANGCDTVLNITISEPDSLIAAFNFINDVSCFNDTNGSISPTVSGGTAPYSFNWSHGKSDSLADNLAAGTYTVTITDNNGCDTTLNAVISQPNQLRVTLSGSDTICPGSPHQLIATVTGGNGNFNYNWQPSLSNDSIQTVNPSSNTTYFIEVTDMNECRSNIDSANLIVRTLDKALLQTFKTRDVCEGDTLSILGKYTSNIPGPYFFSWNNGLLTGLGPHVVNPVSNTNYILEVRDVCNNSIFDTVSVIVSPYPEINLSDTIAQGCPPLSVNFMNNGAVPIGSTFSWNFGNGQVSGSSSPTVIYNESRVYPISLEIVSNNGCVSRNSSSSLVYVYPEPIADFFANPTRTDIRTPAIVFTANSFGATNFTWDFGDGASSVLSPVTHTYQDTGSFFSTLIVNNEFGCLDTAIELIRIDPYFEIEIPNAFKPLDGASGGFYPPNYGGIDIFHPHTNGVENYHLMIFNRWGELLFESFDLYKGWDGFYKGQLSTRGVYIWKLEVKWINDQSYSGMGDVTLIR